MLTYKVQYVPPGQPAVTTAYESERPFEAGQWIAVGATYLVVERVVRGKPGDPYAGIALCKIVVG